MPELNKPVATETVQFQIEKTEALELENYSLKANSLQMQIQSLQEGQNQVIISICKRVGQKPENLARIDPQTWMIHFKKEAPVSAAGAPPKKKTQAKVLPMPPKK